jgi:hypothetical protein
MLELAMASARSHEVPTIVVKHPQNLTDLQAANLSADVRSNLAA